MVAGNNTATFICMAEGLPRPSIMWYSLVTETPQKIAQGGRFSVETVEGAGDRQVTSTLTITNAQPLLAGKYACNATNEVAMDVAIVTLTVYSESVTSFHDELLATDSLSQLFL